MGGGRREEEEEEEVEEEDEEEDEEDNDEDDEEDEDECVSFKLTFYFISGGATYRRSASVSQRHRGNSTVALHTCSDEVDAITTVLAYEAVTRTSARLLATGCAGCIQKDIVCCRRVYIILVVEVKADTRWSCRARCLCSRHISVGTTPNMEWGFFVKGWKTIPVANNIIKCRCEGDAVIATSSCDT